MVDGALRAAPHVLAHAAVDLVLGLVALGHRVLISWCFCERIAPSSVPDLPKPTGLAEAPDKPWVAKRRASTFLLFSEKCPRPWQRHVRKIAGVSRDARFLRGKVAQVKFAKSN
jgi:hypothetical protein